MIFPVNRVPLLWIDCAWSIAGPTSECYTKYKVPVPLSNATGSTTALNHPRSKAGSDTLSSLHDITMRLPRVPLLLYGLLTAVAHGRSYDCIEGDIYDILLDLAVSDDGFVAA